VTTIDFHFNTADRLLHACRLVRKAFHSGKVSEEKPLLVYCSIESRLRQFDDLLYEFSEADFIPHVDAEHPLAGESPVLLCRESHTPLAPRTPFVLINLDDEVPDFFSRFDRVFEVVGPDEDDKQRARLRYTFYRDRGYAITRHDLSAANPTDHTP
jgi:DNA polymerase-3 subunit chi